MKLNKIINLHNIIILIKSILSLLIIFIKTKNANKKVQKKYII
jgi:hypothetical protein